MSLKELFMKLNKKMLAINVVATILMTDIAMAGITRVSKPSTSSGSGQSPSSTQVTQESNSPFIEITSNDTSNCVSGYDSEIFFPLELFTQLARNEGDKVDIQVRPNNQIAVKIPPVINVCGEFIPKIIQNEVTKNVTVMIQLKGTDGKMRNHKDLEDCLSTNKILVDGKIDHDKVPKTGYTESNTSFGYKFDKKTEVVNDITVSYAFPKSYNSADGYKPLYGIIENAPPIPGQKCMLSEKIAGNSTYINEGAEAWIEKINTACETRNVDEIISVKRSAGNAPALHHIMAKVMDEMDTAIFNLSKPEAERINNEMIAIETKLNKNRDSMDEAQAKKEIVKYTNLVKELDAKFLNPAIYRLDNLMKKRDTIADDDSAEMKAIDEEIKNLNDEIGKFSKKNQASFVSLYSTMEKYAFNDSAKIIEDIRLKSHFYSQVYGGPTDSKRGKPITFEKANKEQFNRLKSFEKSLDSWTDVYLVGQGNMFPVVKTEKEREGAINRMNSRYAAFQKKEMTDYNNYCSGGMTGGMRNPVKCKQFMSGRDKRMNAELKKREKDLYYIKDKDNKLTKMGMTYNEYQRGLASQEDAELFDPTGSSYTSYEDNFSDRFPGYFGPTMSSAYDASMYNMSGNSVNLGQTPMMITQQQQFMPQQGYQFQMPQQQQQQQYAQWPSFQ